MSRVNSCIYNARNVLEELSREGNRFASVFMEKLLAKTIHSEGGGIWAFAYITTPRGLEFA